MERARREADEIRSLLSAFSRCITRIMHTCSNCRWPRRKRKERRNRERKRGKEDREKREETRQFVLFSKRGRDRCAEGVPTRRHRFCT